MKKILYLFLVTFFVLKIFSVQVAAVADNPAGSVPLPSVTQTIPQPGINCGDPNATDPNVRRCCYFPKVEAPSVIRTGNAFIDPLVDSFKALTDKVVAPVAAPINDLTGRIIQPCIDGIPSTSQQQGGTTSLSISYDYSDPSCTCSIAPVDPATALVPLCANISRANGSTEYNSCFNCMTGNGGKELGVWTSLGCIYTNPRSFIQEIVAGWGIGIAGGFALLCIIYAAFQIQTSQGNPEKLKKAQEMITSCIMGLMLIIFSVFILRLIGVTILQIPGFG